ncbi:hypothetical protein Aglo03_08310 [Actinokineospora globicatena]|uniref:Uncharacterized protein n=2 Tax=Actinokineospora globicatena TaxID=103729 RepID=A0A9W6QHV9_9PSEU|nr:hypothetical protein Aglo03_08310 [Actinokineospora globicatena]
MRNIAVVLRDRVGGSMRKIAAIVAACAFALTGVVGAGTAQAVPIPCSVSHFKVVWSEAGIYDDFGNLVAALHYGNTIDGPTGGTSGGNTRVFWNGYTRNMADAALQYTGCN